MKRNKEDPHSKSLKTAFIYGGVVCLLILVALFLKGISLLRESTYDGEHQYVVAFSDTTHTVEIVAFEKVSDSIRIVTINTTHTLSPLWRSASIIPDGLLFQPMRSPSVLSSTLLGKVLSVSKQKNHMTSLDAFRLFLFAKTISPSKMTTYTVTIHNPSDTKQLLQLLTDETVAQENASLSIVNASGITGEGALLDGILSTTGVNVLSVTSQDLITNHSQLMYSGDKTYTVIRLSSLLHLTPEHVATKGISDILVILGKGGLGSLLSKN